MVSVVIFPPRHFLKLIQDFNLKNKLDALEYGFSHVSKSSHFATEKNYLVMTKRTEQSTARNYLGSITQ